MSAEPTRGFLRTLLRVDSGLRIPVPRRVKIVREIAYDLQQLEHALQAQGMSPERARGRALEVLAPDAQTLEFLDRLHASPYRRLTAGLSPEKIRRLERGAVVGASVAVLLLQGGLLLRADLLSDPSAFLWPVLGAGALLGAAVLTRFFQIWIKGDGELPARGPLLPILIAAPVCIGTVGVFVDSIRLAATMEAGGSADLVQRWLVQVSALLAVSIILAMAGAVAWYVLTAWTAVVRGAREDALSLPTTQPQTRSTEP